MIKDQLTIADFVEGFRYQMKERFADGTVKTREDYDNAKWVDEIFTEDDRSYIERMFNGKNAANGLFGLRRPVNYRVAQYGKLFFVEMKMISIQNVHLFKKVMSQNWSRVDIFGMPLTNYGLELPPYNSLEDAFSAIKELPGEVPTPQYFYPEK